MVDLFFVKAVHLKCQADFSVNSNGTLLRAPCKFYCLQHPSQLVSKYLQALQLNSLSVLVLSLKCILEGITLFRNEELT